jgi:hypothetical protein
MKGQSRMTMKNLGGRPPKYKKREDLQYKIDEYFESCWIDKITQVTDKDGNITESNVRYQNRPYTIMGLALHLGMTRETLCQYAKDGRFSDIVKKAKQTVEMYVEEMLLLAKMQPPDLLVKESRDYKDKTEQEHTFNKPFVMINVRSSRNTTDT